MFTSYRDKLKYTISRQKYESPTSAMATIIRVYPEKYTCDILIVEPTDGSVAHQAHNVQLPYIGGMSYSLPHAGDKVLVTFINGDVQYPVITNMYVSNSLQLASHTKVSSSTIQHFSDLR